MQALQDLGKVSVRFDDATIISCAGLLAPAAFMQRLGLAGLFSDRLDLDRFGANSDVKAATVIGAMLAGGDCIDDTGLLRAGGCEQLLGPVRAPSTIGSWLRDFRWHNARELDAIHRELLARLWAFGAGPADLDAPLTFDIDSTIVEVRGRSKQGARYGYTKALGYHPLLATLAETGQVLAHRLRGGNAGAARSAAGFLAETVSRIRHAGATGQLTTRLDSAFYSASVVGKAKQLNVRFSITARQDKKIARTIAAIPEADWQPIPYWSSTDTESAADVAETSYTCFENTKQPVQVRLVVRRVRPNRGSQLELFTNWSYHPFITDRDLDLFDVEADHRRHAIVEQSIAELKSAGLRHFPSGRFGANAAWLALSCMAHNIARGVAILAGAAMARATAATLRTRLFTIPGRLIRSGRRLHLRMPTHWPWAKAFQQAMATITALRPAPT